MLSVCGKGLADQCKSDLNKDLWQHGRFKNLLTTCFLRVTMVRKSLPGKAVGNQVPQETKQRTLKSYAKAMLQHLLTACPLSNRQA